jgi:HPt (histidine-containing phosphotransfer) domain-containing protein
MGTGAAIADALKALWVKFLPQMQERVSAIEEANRALQTGTLSSGQRSAAAEAAHKLAGVLGTFGLTSGTELAREAEDLYASETSIDQDGLARLNFIAQQLTAIIQGHV